MDCAEWIINEQEIMCFASSNFSALRRPFHRREADRISLLRRRGRRKSTADPLWWSRGDGSSTVHNDLFLVEIKKKQARLHNKYLVH